MGFEICRVFQLCYNLCRWPGE